MAADRYLKVILTIIALELGWLALKDAGVPVLAQRGQPNPMQVVLTGVELPSRESLPVTLTGNNAVVPVMSARPMQIEQPLIIMADRPLPVENGPRPLVIQSVPAAAAPRPGPGE